MFVSGKICQIILYNYMYKLYNTKVRMVYCIFCGFTDYNFDLKYCFSFSEHRFCLKLENSADLEEMLHYAFRDFWSERVKHA